MMEQEEIYSKVMRAGRRTYFLMSVKPKQEITT